MGALIGCLVIALVLFFCLVALGELFERIADELKRIADALENDGPNNDDVAK